MTSRTFLQIATSFLMLFILPAYGFSASDTYCVPATPELKQMEQRNIVLRTGTVNHSLNAHIADQPQEQAAGFQYICPDVYTTTQILFVYNREINARFHMRNVRKSLDIGFFDMNGRLMEIHTMQPYPAGTMRGPLTGPSKPFRFALETNEGYFDEHQLQAGKTILEWSN